MDHPAAPSSAPTPAPSPDDEDAALQRALARELSEMAMEVCRAIARQVKTVEAAAAPASVPLTPAGLAALMADPDPDPVPADAASSSSTAGAAAPRVLTPGELGLAFDRAARAARRSIALWSQLTHDGPARAAVQARMAQAARVEAAAQRRVQAERIVERVAADHYEAALPGEADDAAAVEAVRGLGREARERLGDEGLYGDLPDRPFSEIVARICADLGLSPDWRKLAGEQWARAELAGAAPGAPLRDLGPVASPPPAASAPAEPASENGSPAQGPPLKSRAWRRRRALRADPQAAPEQTRVTVRFLEPDGSFSYLGDRPRKPDRAPQAQAPWPPPSGPDPEPEPEPEPPPEPPPQPPPMSEEEIAAVRLAERMHFAEYGPRGNGRPDLR